MAVMMKETMKTLFSRIPITRARGNPLSDWGLTWTPDEPAKRGAATLGNSATSAQAGYRWSPRELVWCL